MVTFLSGGTGTPKLLWGADPVFSPSESTVIGNTGDDVVLGDIHVSPDIDTVIFERSDELDRSRWWGIEGDPTETNTHLGVLGEAIDLGTAPRYLPAEKQTEGRGLSRWRQFARVPEFMTIGDRDRAHHLVRTQLLEDGYSLTETTRKLASAYGLAVELLPMSDDPVATVIHTPEGLMHFQEYWVAHRGTPSVGDVEFRGAGDATIPDAVVRALDEPVIVGPANPVTSLGPMLAIDAFAEKLDRTAVVMVSPFVDDRVFSGPAGELMAGIGRDPSTAGVAAYLPQVDAFVLDEDDDTLLDRPIVRTDTSIETPADATRVATACRNALAEVR